MTRIWTEGFEIGHVLFFEPGGGQTIATIQKRSGSYSSSLGTSVKTIAPVSEFYVRFAWMSTSLMSQAMFIWRSGTTVLGRVYFDNSVGHQHLDLQVGTTTVASGSIVIGASIWYVIELHVKIADSGGVLEVKIDGIADATYTSADTKPGTAATADNVVFQRLSSWDYVDDLALNDTSGSADNSWCGDGRIVALTPNANGDVSQLVGQDGNSTDNYLNVDETPHDSDTTYNQSGTVDQYDLYNLTPMSAIPTLMNISRVFVQAVARDTVANGGLCQLGIKSGTTEDWSGDLSMLNTYTTNLVGNVYTMDPNTSEAWSVAALDALQVGFKAR